MRVDLLLTPVPLARTDLENKTVVVIDVLRSSTSIATALTAGAKGVIPTGRPGEAGDMWSRLGGDMAVLAGERGGIKIENFQLGNSPSEFTEENVAGKFVVTCTTNGTVIFGNAAGAETVLSSGLVNASAVAEHVAGLGQDCLIVCSGNEGGFSIEDTLCGGLLVHSLSAVHKVTTELGDAASLALLLYRANSSAIRKAIQQGEHGKLLQSLGFGDDVVTATDVDSRPVVPVLKDGRLIRLEDLPE